MALNVLPAVFADDPERATRFKRGVEGLASLDHPNVPPIFGIVDAEAGRALALVLVEGATLAGRIVTGPIPVEEAVNVAQQIIEALEYAHERGVVHRDLTPANIKITPDGVVNVLDFGWQRFSTMSKRLPLRPKRAPPGGSLAYASAASANASNQNLSHREVVYSLFASVGLVLRFTPPLRSQTNQSRCSRTK